MDDRQDLWFRLSIAGLLGVIAGSAVFGAYWLRYEPEPEAARPEGSTLLILNGGEVECAAAIAAEVVADAGLGSAAAGNQARQPVSEIRFVRGHRPVAQRMAAALGLIGVTPVRVPARAGEAEVTIVLGVDHAARVAGLADCPA